MKNPEFALHIAVNGVKGNILAALYPATGT